MSLPFSPPPPAPISPYPPRAPPRLLFLPWAYFRPKTNATICALSLWTQLTADSMVIWWFSACCESRSRRNSAYLWNVFDVKAYCGGRVGRQRSGRHKLSDENKIGWDMRNVPVLLLNIVFEVVLKKVTYKCVSLADFPHAKVQCKNSLHDGFKYNAKRENLYLDAQ
jgi:hypothetical protein